MKARYKLFTWMLTTILMPFGGIAQDSVLSRSIDIEKSSEYGYTLINGWNDNYLIASFSTCSNERKPCVGLVEIDSNLNTIQKKLYRNTKYGNNFSGRDGLTVINENKLAFLSRFYKQRTDSTGYYSILLTIMDTNLQVLDTFHYDQDIPGIYFARSIHAVGDSSLLITGAEADPPGSYAEGGSWLKKVRLDNGEVIWERKFNKDEYEAKDFESLEVLSNGDILLGMQLKVAPWKFIGKLIILDETGSLKDQITFDEVIDVSYLPISFVVTALNDSTFGVSWGRYIGFDTTFLRYAPKIYKVNSKGQELWNYEFKIKRGTFKQIYSIRSTKDDGIIGVGYVDWWTFVPEDKILPTDPSSAGWVFKFSSTGQLEWQKFYYDPRHLASSNIKTENYLFDVIETNGGDFIMTGDKTDTIGPNVMNPNIWALKTNADGCLYGHYHCDTLQIVGDSTKRMLDLYTNVVYEWQEMKAKIYPNPVSHQLNIELKEPLSGVLTIVNLEGRKVMEKVIKNDRIIKIDVSNHTNRVYILEIYDMQARKYSRNKFLIQ
ncbi:MAG: T9SS type A sorting domain-containing protein [Candidatus Cyclobacteriaceae bacterium M2_1C_046]